MLRITVALLASTMLLASGCARQKIVAPASAQVALLPEEAIPSDWRRVALAVDQTQLDAMPALWSVALTDAAKLDTRAIVQEGDLLRADAALPRPMPTPGLYRCRSIRLGLPQGAARTARAFTRFKPFDCVISDEKAALGFTKVSGTHRPGGYLWPDGDKRMVFLGGTAERDGEGASAYGEADPTRNRAGVLERIGEFRWRLTLLGQAPVARMEVIELTPAVAVPVLVTR